MSNVRNTFRALGAAALAVPLLMGGAAPAFAATPSAGAYADSYGLLVDVTALTGAIPVQVPEQARATSQCPTGGGTKSNSILEIPADPLANVKVSHDTATADCSGPTAKGVSRIVDADVLTGTPATIHADAITATSTTSCTKAPAGSTDIVNLSIAGNSIPIPSNPIPANTKVLDPVLSLLGLTVILNEQHPASQGRGLVVNAIHVIASDQGAAIPIGGSVLRGDIIVAHAVSGVVCPGGPGSDNGGLPKPDISFHKGASPSVAKPGDTVTYSAVITNQGAADCDVLKLVDHIAPAFELVSSAGPLGTALEKPAPTRGDGGVDAVLRPTGVTVGKGKSVTQTFTVKVKDDATPGTYYDTLEIFCGQAGDFVSGPLAPVTVPAPGQVVEPPANPVETPTTTPVFAPTGLSTTVPALALLLLVGAVGTRRLALSRRS